MAFNRKVMFGVLATIVVGGGLTYWTLGREQTPATQLIRAKIERGLAKAEDRGPMVPVEHFVG